VHLFSSKGTLSGLIELLETLKRKLKNDCHLLGGNLVNNRSKLHEGKDLVHNIDVPLNNLLYGDKRHQGNRAHELVELFAAENDDVKIWS